VRDEPELIIQLPLGSSVDQHLDAAPPEAVTSGRAVLEHLPAGPGGRLLDPAAGEVVLSVLSPEALAREPGEVQRAIRLAEGHGEPLVVIVQAAEQLRDEELAAVLDAAAETNGVVILRILGGA
jgi:hypothetical protein